MLFKLIALTEFIVICALMVIIIQKARYDMEMEEYEDFDAVIAKTDYTYKTVFPLIERKVYYVIVKYKLGSIVIKNFNYYQGFNKGDNVTLRIKVRKNNNGDIISISESKPLILRKNVG